MKHKKETHGELTVVEVLPNRNKHGQKIVHATCSCGGSWEGLLHSLRAGTPTACLSHPKNKITIYKTFALIDISTDKFPNTVTKISPQDVDKVRELNISWYAHDGGDGRLRVISNKTHKRRLARILSGAKPRDIVDHISRDTLDNRQENLRIVTAAENNKNMRKKANNTSGCTGVWIEKSSGLFVAEIKAGRKYFLGRYDSLEHANIAYRAAAKVLGFSPTHGLEDTDKSIIAKTKN